MYLLMQEIAAACTSLLGENEAANTASELSARLNSLVQHAAQVWYGHHALHLMTPLQIRGHFTCVCFDARLANRISEVATCL